MQKSPVSPLPFLHQSQLESNYRLTTVYNSEIYLFPLYDCYLFEKLKRLFFFFFLDNFIIIPFLKLNGKPTNRNDYNFIPIRKTQIQSVFEILIGMLCKPLLDLLTYDDNFQYLIDRFHAIGFKNELLSNGFYQAALDKSIMTFKLKYDLYAFEINDPICVNIDKKEYQSIQIRHDIYCEQIQNLFDNACQLSSIETWKIKVHMGYTYYFLFGYYDKAIDLMKSIINTNM